MLQVQLTTCVTGFVSVIRLTLVLLAFFSAIHPVQAQTLTSPPAAPPSAIYCGAYQQLSAIPENYTGPVYYDRFSNAYPLPEIQAMMAQATTELDAGRFKLLLSNVPQGINQTLVEVFTQVSNTIDPGGNQPNIPILIEWGYLDGNSGAVARPSNFFLIASVSRTP
jgi:hypothetical protein